jgi:hypothetical protein
MRDEARNRCQSAELIENEAARIPDQNHWRAVALREMARMERECWESIFPASALAGRAGEERGALVCDIRDIRGSRPSVILFPGKTGSSPAAC